jgi:hypothetical protein
LKIYLILTFERAQANVNWYSLIANTTVVVMMLESIQTSSRFARWAPRLTNEILHQQQTSAPAPYHRVIASRRAKDGSPNMRSPDSVFREAGTPLMFGENQPVK